MMEYEIKYIPIENENKISIPDGAIIIGKDDKMWQGAKGKSGSGRIQCLIPLKPLKPATSSINTKPKA